MADGRLPQPLPQHIPFVTGNPARAARVPAVAGSPARRLKGLDSVRGLAALYVVANHVFLRAFPGYPVNRAPFWAGWFIYGRFAVVVCIVLSGFSLALSPADLAALFAVGVQAAGIVGASAAGRAWPWAWLALVIPLTIVIARVFASIFEIPFRQPHSRESHPADSGTSSVCAPLRAFVIR